MTPDEWTELQNLFAELVSLDAATRAKRLAAIRADMPEVALELDNILQHSNRSSSSPTGIVSSAARSLASGMDGEAVGERIGPFRIVSHIARGGMGDVYLAERDDGAYEQRVAIKLIGRGPQSRDAERRFAIERQLLAKLDHPNIARILDGGTTANGAAYLAMEYVEGIAIDEFCRSGDLPVRRRLKLFRQVCGAVDFAHRNLIVHRDIKPSNILVTADGVPKLLDFGVAKLLADNDSPVDATVTQLAARAMTPDFASPEQVLGQPVTTASDVYALGVLLYVLLTDGRPYRTAGMRPSQIEKVIVQTLPVRPSQAVLRRAAPALVSGDKRSRHRLLRGDLDDIVLQALRKDVDDRYGSVRELSEDVSRFLEDRPVAARGQTFVYVARKFVQRNSIAVTIATVALALGATAIGYHNKSITAERDRVALEASKAVETTRFLVDIFRISDPDESLGASITAKEILDAGAARLDEDLGDQPAIRAALGTTIGDVYSNLGLYDDALSILERAARIREQLGDREGLAKTLRVIANTQFQAGDFEKARVNYQQSLDLLESLHGADHIDIAVALNDLAHIQFQLGDYDAAIAIHERALPMFERLGETGSRHYADTLHDLGQIQHTTGDMDAAVQNGRMAVEFALQSYGERNSITLTYMHNLASQLHDQYKLEEAEKLFLRVYTLEREILGEDHPTREAGMTSLGRLYKDMGRLDESETYLRQGVEFSERIRGRQHTFTAYNRVNLANLLSLIGEDAEAETQYREALSVYAENLEADHPFIASGNVNFASLLNQLERPDESRLLTERALEICEVSLPDGHWLAASAQSVLGESLMLLGNYDAAEPLLLEGYAGVSNAQPRAQMTVNALQRLERYYGLRGKTTEAERYRQMRADISTP